MYTLFFALYMAFACPTPGHTTASSNTTVVTLDDTGGDNGHIPPAGS